MSITFSVFWTGSRELSSSHRAQGVELRIQDRTIEAEIQEPCEGRVPLEFFEKFFVCNRDEGPFQRPWFHSVRYGHAVCLTLDELKVMRVGVRLIQKDEYFPAKTYLIDKRWIEIGGKRGRCHLDLSHLDSGSIGARISGNADPRELNLQVAFSKVMDLIRQNQMGAIGCDLSLEDLELLKVQASSKGLKTSSGMSVEDCLSEVLEGKRRLAPSEQRGQPRLREPYKPQPSGEVNYASLIEILEQPDYELESLRRDLASRHTVKQLEAFMHKLEAVEEDIMPSTKRLMLYLLS